MELIEIGVVISYADGDTFVGDFDDLENALTSLEHRFGKRAISDVLIIPVYK